MSQIDDETKALALHALKNSFYQDFSALVNAYLEMAQGLDTQLFEMQLSETANVYSRDDTATGDFTPNLWTANIPEDYLFGTTGHLSILGALEHQPAVEVHLQGKKVFEKVDDEWNWSGD